MRGWQCSGARSAPPLLSCFSPPIVRENLCQLEQVSSDHQRSRARGTAWIAMKQLGFAVLQVAPHWLLQWLDETCTKFPLTIGGPKGRHSTPGGTSVGNNVHHVTRPQPSFWGICPLAPPPPRSATVHNIQPFKEHFC